MAWICDPMHGNTESCGGVKTRRYENIRAEVPTHEGPCMQSSAAYSKVANRKFSLLVFVHMCCRQSALTCYRSLRHPYIGYNMPLPLTAG